MIPLIDTPAKLFDLRHRRGWTQRQLGEVLALSEDHVRKMETGRVPITAQMQRHLTYLDHYGPLDIKRRK